MLKYVEKYIDFSELDQDFIKVEIYEPATVKHIKWKHTKRSTEAFMTWYLALFGIYFQNVLEKHPEKEVQEVVLKVVMSTHDLRSLRSSKLNETHTVKCNQIH